MKVTICGVYTRHYKFEKNGQPFECDTQYISCLCPLDKDKENGSGFVSKEYKINDRTAKAGFTEWSEILNKDVYLETRYSKTYGAVFVKSITYNNKK